MSSSARTSAAPAPATPSPTSASSADSLSTSTAKTNPFTAVSTANNPTLVATPAPVTIAEGSTDAAFSLPTGGSTLLAPASLKIYATDGSVSPSGRLTLVPATQLTVGKTGKGTVTTNPAGTTFAAGTVVTLTATPDVGSPWIGWSGGVTSTSKTVTVTMKSNLSLTANFK